MASGKKGRRRKPAARRAARRVSRPRPLPKAQRPAGRPRPHPTTRPPTPAPERRQAPPERRQAPPERRQAPRGEEARLLALARELASLETAGLAPGDRLRDAILRVTGDRVSAQPRTRAEKLRALALGWAREQVRLALQDIIGAAAAAGVARSDVEPDTLAWLLLAGADALMHESGDAAGDRLLALDQFIAPPP
jgi:hypothetical protein